ncbi:MAG: hypothetical protein ACO3S5_12145 [Ilumatobacteraceae bacterium]
MQNVVLITVLGVWAAVLVPPLMRNRVDNRPNSSVSDFRRQLSTLERSVPTRTVSVRGMARPLAQAPRRPAPQRRPQQSHRQAHLHRVSAREMQRRRRANVLFVLVLTTAVSGFLAATTKAGAMTWTFGIAFFALCGYCYKLAQLRNIEASRSDTSPGWYHAA